MHSFRLSPARAPGKKRAGIYYDTVECSQNWLRHLLPLLPPFETLQQATATEPLTQLLASYVTSAQGKGNSDKLWKGGDDSTDRPTDRARDLCELPAAAIRREADAKARTVELWGGRGEERTSSVADDAKEAYAPEYSSVARLLGLEEEAGIEKWRRSAGRARGIIRHMTNRGNAA